MNGPLGTIGQQYSQTIAERYGIATVNQAIQEEEENATNSEPGNVQATEQQGEPAVLSEDGDGVQDVHGEAADDTQNDVPSSD